jgi:hypothetical protein
MQSYFSDFPCWCMLDVNMCHTIEGPIRRTREGGSEWEPIKILLEGDGNSYKMNTASNTRLRLTTQVGQAHVATGVPLDLGTNTHNLPTRERNGTPNLESIHQHRSDRWAPPVRPVPAGETGQLSLSGSTLVRPVRRTGQTGHSLKAPKAPNRPTDLQTNPNSKSCNTGQQRTHPDVHPSKNPPRVAPVRPVKSTGQTGVAWAARDEQHPRVNSPKSKPRSPESLHGLEQDFGDIRNTSWGVHRQV